MIPLNLVDLPAAIPLSVFTGSTGMQDVIDHMNAKWHTQGSGVIFGEGMFADRYRAFTDLISNRQSAAIKAVEKTVQSIACPNMFQIIDSQDALENVPPCMYVPLLTFAPMRKLFEDGRIQGWGVKLEELPEEDVCGRMINDGRFVSTDEAWRNDPEAGVKYVVKTGDPNYTREQLDMIETSRGWLDTWLEEQLGPGGDELDPTDLPNQMGKLRSPD
jgi:hypothetical protein